MGGAQEVRLLLGIICYAKSNQTGSGANELGVVGRERRKEAFCLRHSPSGLSV